MADREMNLQEWVERLPSCHLARREHEALQEQVRELMEALQFVADYYTPDEAYNMIPDMNGQTLQDNLLEVIMNSREVLAKHTTEEGE